MLSYVSMFLCGNFFISQICIVNFFFEWLKLSEMNLSNVFALQTFLQGTFKAYPIHLFLAAQNCFALIFIS